MKLTMHIAEAFVGHVGINLGGGDILMAEKFLDSP